MAKTLESNRVVEPVIGPIAKDAFDIYRNMLNASKFLYNPICTLCTNSPTKVRTHFHGSEFGSCFRQTQLSMLNPKVVTEQDNTTNIFLFDGHLHEEAAMKLLSNDYEISHHDEEIIVTKEINLYGVTVPVTIITHPDLKLTTPNRTLLVEFKAVKDWAIKNKVDKSIIPEVYYGQCQIYMEALDLEYTLLIFKSRHTSMIYPPFIIKRNTQYIDQRFRFLAGILYSNQKPEMVPKAYTDKTCDACKFCNFYQVCWGK